MPINTPAYAEPTTLRADLAAGLGALMSAFIAANPGAVHSHWDARPGAFIDLPLTFCGSFDETIVHDGQTRSRTMICELVLVDILAENQETAGRVNPTVDSLIDWLTANPHLGTYGFIAQAVGVIGQDVAEAGGEAGTWHFEIIRVQAAVQEGRE